MIFWGKDSNEKTKNIYEIFLCKFPKIIIYIWIQQFYFGEKQKYLWKLFYTMKKQLKNRDTIIFKKVYMNWFYIFFCFVNVCLNVNSNCNLTPLSCSWHQITKPWILFSPIFSNNVSQFELLKRKQTIHWPEKKFGEQFGKTRFVVWWFDVTNKILVTVHSVLSTQHMFCFVIIRR